MESYELIISLATFIGVIAGIVINTIISRKKRHSEILSTRRKERMDNFIVYYSKISALVHPDNINTYVKHNGGLYFENLIENYSNLNMLFDHRFEKDAQLAHFIKSLVHKAVDYYLVCQTKGYSTSKEHSKEANRKYKDEYLLNIKNTDKLLNIYIHTEWSRLKNEVLEGKPISHEKWKKIYEDAKEYYEKWDDFPVKCPAGLLI